MRTVVYINAEKNLSEVGMSESFFNKLVIYPHNNTAGYLVLETSDCGNPDMDELTDFLLEADDLEIEVMDYSKQDFVAVTENTKYSFKANDEDHANELATKLVDRNILEVYQTDYLGNRL